MAPPHVLPFARPTATRTAVRWQWVCAFEAPFGPSRTLTSGVIFAVCRRRLGYLAKRLRYVHSLYTRDFTSGTPIDFGNPRNLSSNFRATS